MNKIEEARKILKKYKQNHINVETEEIADQILKIDFEQLKELFEQTLENNLITNVENIEPVKAINPDKIEKQELQEYISIGENEVKSGKFAVAIMAGGQGTRLEHIGPKGTYKLELNGETKSLFEVVVEKLKTAYSI